MFIFPYSIIQKGCRIALYGAGKVGQDFFVQIVGSGYCDLNIWVDRCFEKYRELNMPVYPVEALKDIAFDYILIAVMNKEAACQIMEDLASMGIEDNNIYIWQEYENFEMWNVEERYREGLRKNKKKADCHMKADRCGERRFWIVNSPCHGNVGDIAIYISTKHYLSQYYPGIVIENCTSADLDNGLDMIKTKIGSKDILFVIGGGFMGVLWENEDKRVQRVIEAFPDNKIIFMPQTFYYGNNKQKIQKDKDFYQNHKNLLFLHREKKSQEFFLNHINSDIKRNHCFPDMVFYLEKNIKTDNERKGILICLRNDKEQALDSRQKQMILEQACDMDNDVKEMDTVYPGAFEIFTPYGLFCSKIKYFQTSKLVITDRLHGMIFSYITGTPCIAFDNLSGKSTGIYEWINECNFITIKKDVSNIKKDIEKMMKIDVGNQSDLTSYFSDMKNVIDQFIINYGE